MMRRRHASYNRSITNEPVQPILQITAAHRCAKTRVVRWACACITIPVYLRGEAHHTLKRACTAGVLNACAFDGQKKTTVLVAQGAD